MKNSYMKCIVIIIFFLMIGVGVVPCMRGNIGQASISSGITFNYIVITNSYLESSNFQLLINYKSQYLTARIVTKEDVVSNPDYWVDGIYGDATSSSNGNPFVKDGEEVTQNFDRFNDTQAKIRNFIRFAYLEWNTRYVLLGGDVQIIPVRQFRIHDALWFNGLDYEEIDADIRSDLYYSCLEGTWNNDFDEYFGEEADYSTGDEADFTAEVYVGRAPVDNKNDVITFVNKVINFETSEKPNNIQLHQSGVNQLNIPDSTVIPDACAALIPSSFNINKLYQVNEVVTLEKWVQCFEATDKLIIAHVGCGMETYYLLNYEVANTIEFSITDVNKLGNNFYPVHISIACFSGDFGAEKDCLAEELLLWQYGGPSACIFNTFYGFTTHNDALAYSGQYMVRQFYEIFQNGTENLGKIIHFSKQYYIDYARKNYGDRWCYYTINLLGDPETPMFQTREKGYLNDEVYIDDDYEPSTPGWGVDHFNIIQVGVSSVTENGIVHVYNGTYNENILIDKTINLIGESSDNTIIDGGSNNVVIEIHANSTVIENFTIQHSNPKPEMGNITGIKICPLYEGNQINYNIIQNNSKFGILILGSYHNRIQQNIIRSNGIGIALINPEHLNEGNTNVPCENIIRRNKITLSETLGIYTAFASNNHIWRNRFVDNKASEELPGISPDAFFIKTENQSNEWGGNYWNKPLFTPKIIHGRVGPIELFGVNLSENIDKGNSGFEYDSTPMNIVKGTLYTKQNSRILLYELLNIILSKIFKAFQILQL